MVSGNIKIQALRVRAVRVPMSEPHRTASGVVAESPLVLTDLITDQGIVGHSLVFTYTTLALQPTADLIRNLEPLVAGQALAPRAMSERLAARFRLLGQQGLTGIAMAAIDMAAWDALARAHGVPLYQLLGGEPRAVRAYGAIGYDGPTESARVAERWARRGFTGVKAKIGYSSMAEDRETIRAIRAAAGPEMSIMVDYNQCLTAAEAIERIGALAGENLTWVEEPCRSHDFASHAEVTRQVATPIQAGENWWGPRDFQTAIDLHSTDYLMPDVMNVGGVTGWLDVAAIAAARGLRVSNHLWPEISAHLLSVTPTAHWLEWADWWHPVIAQPLEVGGDGWATPSAAPGSGVERNEAAVKEFLV